LFRPVKLLLDNLLMLFLQVVAEQYFVRQAVVGQLQYEKVHSDKMRCEMGRSDKIQYVGKGAFGQTSAEQDVVG
jgi:hypothetical protein